MVEISKEDFTDLLKNDSKVDQPAQQMPNVESMNDIPILQEVKISIFLS